MGSLGIQCLLFLSWPDIWQQLFTNVLSFCFCGVYTPKWIFSKGWRQATETNLFTGNIQLTYRQWQLAPQKENWKAEKGKHLKQKPRLWRVYGEASGAKKQAGGDAGSRSRPSPSAAQNTAEAGLVSTAEAAISPGAAMCLIYKIRSN